RSFDHYFGVLSKHGQPDAEGPPANYSNPDRAGAAVSPYHLTGLCIEQDPPHQGAAMIAGYGNGKMGGFVQWAATGGSNGHYVMGYYDDMDLPFYYWLANTFSLADHYFAPTLGGTWPNRDYMYAGTSEGITDTGQGTINVTNIYDVLTRANISW